MSGRKLNPWLLALTLAAGCSEARQRTPTPGGDEVPTRGDTHGGCAGDPKAAGDVCVTSGDTFEPGDPPQAGDHVASWGDDESGDAIEPGDLAASLCSILPPPAVVNVTVHDLKDLIDANATLAVVDVREPIETDGGIIAGALLFPWNSDVLRDDHANLPDDRPLYVICASGGRSGLASSFLHNNGHRCVHNVQGGMNAWKTAGYPTILP